MPIKGARCPICTAQFVKGEIGALRCGHTYHEACIRMWLQKNKTCPNCRARTLEQDVIKQLYFDIDELDMSILADSSSTDLALQIEDLKTSLNSARTESVELRQTVSSYNTKISDLNSQITKLKAMIVKRDNKTTTDAEKIRKLEFSIEIQKQKADLIIAENKELNKKQTFLESSLKASEFYQLIVKAKGDKEENITETYRKYINSDGDPIIENFIAMLKKKVTQYKDKLTKAEDDFKEQGDEMKKLKEDKRKLENLVTALTNECIETRDSNNVSTPYNTKLMPMLVNRSPVKRISMGFDETINLDINTFESALRKPAAKKFSFPLPSISTAETKNMDNVVVRDLDHFCELYDQNVIPIVETGISDETLLIDKGDGVLIPKSTYETRNEPTSTKVIPVSIVAQAHRRMENENQEKEAQLFSKATITKTARNDNPKRVCPRGVQKKDGKKLTRVDSKEKTRDTARISQFFSRTERPLVSNLSPLKNRKYQRNNIGEVEVIYID